MKPKAASGTLVLNAQQLTQKVHRIAYEIYENNFSEKSIVLAGIDGQGYVLAKLIMKQVESISPIRVQLVCVSLDKLSPVQSTVTLDAAVSSIKKKTIILVDDVLNTGRTLAYALKPFLEVEIKKIEVAVLVNRSHTLFPIVPTYSGYQLATTLTDHVEVKLGKEAAVYLR
ncbi:MAG: phosphoribosyltransferase [Bacteroidetes bacterium]|nr:phosphoribosyltransferase [Bacteroidota bacterium]MBS1540787.1 phosphoribosyltransferase [Bacteroidota bacterium]